ncbi:ClpA/ClpB-like protein [Kribbella sp. VKM Ac-2569]|uniref:AAA family ATPase n=1 Tax=Kribbella sp. VKM Ac-2569 TaxID=2512220 RepID=UPI00102BCEDA|nr:AAA family ATPase [Kribbella sp. VKM Ac-2569]RZT17510.1 ClpA/ClpB-like protein [Kribbella sp. VKM Ac-2569]
MSPPETSTLPGSLWLQRLAHEVNRQRHLVIHGNIDDLVRSSNRYDTLTNSVFDALRVLGFAVLARYSIDEGLTFANESHRREIERLSGQEGSMSVTAPAPMPDRGASGQAEAVGPRQSRLNTAREQITGQLRTAPRARARNPAEALAALVPMLTQTATPCAIIIDSPDLLIGQAGQVTDQFPAQVAYVRRLVRTAAIPAPGDLRNTLIFVTRDLADVPIWLRESPHVAVVPAELPRIEERRQLLSETMPSYHRDDELTDQMRDQALSTLVNLTEGMTALDIQSLTATSRKAGIEAGDGRRLLARHRFALRDDPWEKLDLVKIRNSAEILGRRVVGQEHAVHEVSNILANARVGIDFVAEGTEGSRPKGVFFFVGPTGVGKTELAKSIAELVFDDEKAMRRFDMSEYMQEHAGERLTGAPPGFIGHEQGGVLTNWMLERPFSVVLFDEIEKAHTKIYDKFLQIIDDGRLTDGQGRTAYFSHSIVIFTSNIGAAGLANLPANPSYSVVAKHFRDEVEEYFHSKLQRPEFLGRLGGGVVPFDLLRPEVIGQIVDKFLDQLTASALAKGFELVVDRLDLIEEVQAHLMGAGPRYGAREIRSPMLEQWVQVPLSHWMLQHTPTPGTRIRVYRTAESPPFAIDALTHNDHAIERTRR